jgi:hypothetical protein
MVSQGACGVCVGILVVGLAFSSTVRLPSAAVQSATPAVLYKSANNFHDLPESVGPAPRHVDFRGWRAIHALCRFGGRTSRVDF